MRLSVRLLPIRTLKPHELTDPNRVERLKEEILNAGAILNPLWVEMKNLIVLNGHHRLKALENLGCIHAPAVLLDYDDKNIEVDVCPGANISKIDKDSIVSRALVGALYPPRSSLHKLNFKAPDCFFSITDLTETI